MAQITSVHMQFDWKIYSIANLFCAICSNGKKRENPHTLMPVEYFWYSYNMCPKHFETARVLLAIFMQHL